MAHIDWSKQADRNTWYAYRHGESIGRIDENNGNYSWYLKWTGAPVYSTEQITLEDAKANLQKLFDDYLAKLHLDAIDPPASIIMWKQTFESLVGMLGSTMIACIYRDEDADEVELHMAGMIEDDDKVRIFSDKRGVNALAHARNVAELELCAYLEEVGLEVGTFTEADIEYTKSILKFKATKNKGSICTKGQFAISITTILEFTKTAKNYKWKTLFPGKQVIGTVKDFSELEPMAMDIWHTFLKESNLKYSEISI